MNFYKRNTLKDEYEDGRNKAEQCAFMLCIYRAKTHKNLSIPPCRLRFGVCV